MRLSENFSLFEFVDSPTAQAHQIDNTPSLQIIKNLTVVAESLEKVRKLLGNKPIHINSGYRCEALNTLVGGVVNSAHMDGYAADFVCPEFGTVAQIIDYIKNKIEFDQLIDESRSKDEANWVHISFAPRLKHVVMSLAT